MDKEKVLLNLCNKMKDLGFDETIISNFYNASIDNSKFEYYFSEHNVDKLLSFNTLDEFKNYINQLIQDSVYHKYDLNTPHRNKLWMVNKYIVKLKSIFILIVIIAFIGLCKMYL